MTGPKTGGRSVRISLWTFPFFKTINNQATTVA